MYCNMNVKKICSELMYYNNMHACRSGGCSARHIHVNFPSDDSRVVNWKCDRSVANYTPVDFP